ncbi:MAG: Ig-like domain-containing protein [Spirochaetales bacterium]|nr:Ig-like domain-containing protein [Spirochaetales bacterium]
MNRISLRLLAVIMLCSSCLFSLEELEVEFSISEMNEVIGTESELWAEFNMDVVHIGAETAFSINDPYDRKIEGDISWEDNRLVFTPTDDLLPGRRYTISIDGIIGIEDGRDFYVQEMMPFYYSTDEKPAVLTDHHPGSGAMVPATEILSFTFDRTINEDSFIENFRLTPDTAFTHELSEDNMSMYIIPETTWTNLKTYSWEIGSEYRDNLDIPLLQACEGSFIVIEDTEAPVLTQLAAVCDIDIGTETPYLQRPASTENLLENTVQYHDGLLFGFSEAVQFDVLHSPVRITPAIQGSWYDLDPSSFLFVPESGWTMDQEYTVAISDDLTDMYDNALYMEEPVIFIPDIPLLEIISIDTGSLHLGPDDYHYENSVDVELVRDIAEPTEYYQIFEFTFSRPFLTPEEKQDALDSISFCRKFGGSSGGEYIGIRGISWGPLDNHVSIIWTGMKGDPSSEQIFYELSISEGPGGLHNSEGSFLKEAVNILLQWVE